MSGITAGSTGSTLNASEYDRSQDSYDLTAHGTVTYSWAETVRDLDSQATVARGGTIIFAIHETGDDSEQDDFSMSLTDSATTDKNFTWYGTRRGTGTEHETANGTHTRSGNFDTGDYTWNESGSIASTLTGSGVTDNGHFTRTETATGSIRQRRWQLRRRNLRRHAFEVDKHYHNRERR